MSNQQSRRNFLQTTAAAAGATMPYWAWSPRSFAEEQKSPNERLRVGCIATGDRWMGGVGPNVLRVADCLAVCDVDANHMAAGKQKVIDMQSKPGMSLVVDTYEDYRKILDRKDIDIVTIVTTDHWHSKIAVEAMQAGKDVYCEKPLTLTINEGKQIRKVLDETKRVFQVGTQQRSEMGLLFLKAVAMVKNGRIGKVQKVTCDIGGAPGSGEIGLAPVPEGLNWELWQGQTPLREYRSKPMGDPNAKYPHSRTHYEFRWWYEYSGGKMTDWGAHHVDIASWALGMDELGPVSVEPVEGTVVHPCPLDANGNPTRDDMYNAATAFDVKVMYGDGVELHIVSSSKDGNGILFEGTEGRFHVSRGAMKGAPVEDLAKNPITDEMIEKLYKGKKPGDHMRNFIECVKDRTQPISDVHTHHRAMTTCHLANIAIRLNRKINWDPKLETIVGDDNARNWLGREQRKGYEINVPI